MSPIGVVAIISPWNYPFSIPMAQVIAAIIAGNAVVLKPSELTPATRQSWLAICSNTRNFRRSLCKCCREAAK